MAVLGRLLLGSGERLDLQDALSIDSYSAGDWKFFMNSLVGSDQPYIIKGFDIIDPASAIGTQSCSITVADSIVFFPGSQAGSFYAGLPAGNPASIPLVPQLRKNATNYVYLTFSTFDTASDARAFWDPDQNNGTGADFTQSVNTETVLDIQVNVSTGAFPQNTIPVAIINVGPVVITSIQDARNMLFRLGAGGNSPDPFNRYSFRALPSSLYEREEPPTTITSSSGANPFQGGDKNIYSLKEWMDVVMTKLAELGGTSLWYENAVAFSIINLFIDSIASTVKSKGIFTHSSATPGQVNWSEDLVFKSAVDPRDIILRSGGILLNNEQVGYLTMVREQPLNVGDSEVSWINGQNYVNTVGAAVGLFANLSKGDFVKKVDDPNNYYLRVDEFYSAVNLGGLVTTAGLAQSIRLSSTYLGTTATKKGIYDKGVYQPADIAVSNRNDNALTAAGGNFHWLALRSDVINTIASIQSFTLSGTINSVVAGVANCTVTAHGLQNGDFIQVTAPVAQAGTYQIDVVDVNTFTFLTNNTTTGSLTAHYGLMQTGAYSTPYSLILENADHDYETGDTGIFSGTINFNGSFIVAKRDSTHVEFAIGSTFAQETTGLSTLARVQVRTETGIVKIIQGESINIGDTVAQFIRQYIGMQSPVQVNPDYVTPSGYNTLAGTANYNTDATENLTLRAAKLTAMIADKAQDKTIQLLPIGVDTVNNTTSGPNQLITFVNSGITPTLYVDMPSSSNNGTITLTGTLTMPTNSVAYFTMNRNAVWSVSGLASLSISSIAACPLDENVRIFAVRLGDANVWLWDSFLLDQPVNYYRPGVQLTESIRENASAYFRSNDPIVWNGSQLRFTSDIVLDILNTPSGTPTSHTILAANSPLTLTNGQSVYLEFDRTLTSENITPNIVNTIPAYTSIPSGKEPIVLAHRIDVNGFGYLHLPFHKQVLNPGQVVRLGATGVTEDSLEELDHEIDSLRYQADFVDNFNDLPLAGGSINVSAGFTRTNLFDPLNTYYRLAFDATLTTTITGTSGTVSGVPAFTVAIGDIIRVSDRVRRITNIGSINTDGGTTTPFTIESAFSTNFVAAASTLSQAIYTVDINNYTDSGISIATVFSDNIDTVMVDYDDSTTLESPILTTNGIPYCAYVASADGTNYSQVATRTNAFTTALRETTLNPSGTNLYLRFFSNIISGTGFVNILRYRAFFHKEAGTDDTNFAQNQAYCFTDSSISPVNCANPTVVGGKSRIALNFEYQTGYNAGTVNGQLFVTINGQKIPRFLDATRTPNAFYKEIDSQTIELDDDYSADNFSVEIIQLGSIHDVLVPTTAQVLRSTYDFVVGSLSQVQAGIATHTSIQAAHNDAIAGQSIYVLPGNYTENVTISKTVEIMGKGRGDGTTPTGSQLNGTLTFASGGSYCAVNMIRILNNVTFQVGSTSNFLRQCWLASGFTVSDSGTANSVLVINE